VPSRCLRAVGHRIEPTTGVAALARADAIVVCVPTPLTAAQEPDLGPLADAARAIATVLRRGQLVVLESTTYPGATRELLLPLLEQSGLAAGRDFHLAFSPQRVDPGRADWTLRTTPKVVAGLTDACGDRAEALYAAVCHRVVRVSTLETAELSKLLENLFRAVNVALVNELAGVAERLALDMREVVDAAATKPFGFMRFDPGPGQGGQCLTVDPFALAWRARELDVTIDLVEVVGRLNRRGPERHRTTEDTIELVRRLAAHHPDAQIAAILNKQGRHTGTGLAFTEARVRGIRQRAGIPAAPPPDPDGETVTIQRAARELGVSTATIRRWLNDGLLAAEQTTPHAAWRIRLTDETHRQFVPDVPDGFVALDDAARLLGCARQTLLHKVQRGELRAIHVTRGRRKGLRIEVPNAALDRLLNE
jgi:hypothetical protein